MSEIKSSFEKLLERARNAKKCMFPKTSDTFYESAIKQLQADHAAALRQARVDICKSIETALCGQCEAIKEQCHRLGACREIKVIRSEAERTADPSANDKE